MADGRRWVRWGMALVTGLASVHACGTLVQREDRIRFSHKFHVEDQGIECKDCHQEVMQSDRLPGLPREESCLECHEKKDDNCGLCHLDPARPRSWAIDREPGLRFSHKAHQEPAKGNCATCHSGVEKRTAPPARYDAGHEQCMSCHRKDFRKIECRRCHEDLVDSEASPLGLYSHEGDFLKRHGTLARGDSRVCEHCHRPSDCTDCHQRFDPLTPAERFSEQIGRSLVHRADYLTRHPIEARADPTSCRSCHVDSQCVACHEASGIGQSERGWDRASPHPPGFAMNRSSPDFHGKAASRDIAACATCHDQGASSNCITCHKVGGQAGRSPHPRGWNPAVSKDGPACRGCHR